MASHRRIYDLANENDAEDLRAALLEESEDDPDSDDDDGGGEEADDGSLEEREDDSSTEQSDTSDGDDNSGDKSDQFHTAVRRNKGQEVELWRWNKRPYPNRRRRQNILANDVGTVQGQATSTQTPLQAWECFFDEALIGTIVTHTNQFMELEERSKYARCRDCRPTDATEIKALIGLLYLIGTYRMSHLNNRDFFDDEGFGIDFSFVMTKKRFLLLLHCMRFDDRTTRSERLKEDRLAPIRDLFDAFVSNCQKNYSPGERVTIDEKLEGFRGRCNFRQFIPSKPRKYGIKIFVMADSEVFYAYNLEIYAGAQPEASPFRVSNKPVDVVGRLCRPIEGSGRNVTMDNWFTDVKLVEELARKGLSTVGTLKKNKIEIPNAFKELRSREVSSSMFGFRPNATLVSYVPKHRKNVILISSLHLDNAIDEATGTKRKPEIVTYYNKSKGGVDTNDQMCETYSVKRRTKRWPMVIFYSMLNMAGINSNVIFMKNTNRAVRRRIFLKRLAKELIRPHLQRRSTNVSGIHLPLQIKVRNALQKLDTRLQVLVDNIPQVTNPNSAPSEDIRSESLVDVNTVEESVKDEPNLSVPSSSFNQTISHNGEESPASQVQASVQLRQREMTQVVRSTTSASKRKRCEPCKASKKSRFTQFSCKMCHKFLCLQHSISICDECHQANVSVI